MRRDLSSGRMELVKAPASAGGGLAKSTAAATVLAKGTGAPAVSKADEYTAKAYQVSDPALRNGYLELAAQERAGAR
jgi:hypothetical protein